MYVCVNVYFSSTRGSLWSLYSHEFQSCRLALFSLSLSLSLSLSFSLSLWYNVQRLLVAERDLCREVRANPESFYPYYHKENPACDLRSRPIYRLDSWKLYQSVLFSMEFPPNSPLYSTAAASIPPTLDVVVILRAPLDGRGGVGGGGGREYSPQPVATDARVARLSSEAARLASRHQPELPRFAPMKIRDVTRKL